MLLWPCELCLHANRRKMCRMKQSFFKWAKASGVRNGNPDIANVTGLPFMMFNQRLNIHRITFPTLAQWQLLHHPVLFPGNIYLEKPPEVRSNYVYICWLSVFVLLLLIYLHHFLSVLKFSFICKPCFLHWISNCETITGPKSVWLPIQSDLVLEVKLLSLNALETFIRTQ